jgi:hypothetical protein
MRRTLSCLAAATCILAAGARPAFSFDLPWHDPAPLPGFLSALFQLERPDPAVDEDATGSLALLEYKERSALHVRVRHLDPGAEYDVSIAKGETTESIGKITTADSDQVLPRGTPRCFIARLTGAQEVPPVETDAHGLGFFYVAGRDTLTLHYAVFVRGLSGPATAAHIHAGVKGVGGDVVYPLDAEALKGSFEITVADVEKLAAEEYYVNVHTEKNPDGEVRGQIKPCFPFGLPFLDRIDRSGSGKLKLDTRRGDALPLGATSIKDLIGAKLSVANAAGNVVLSVEITDFTQPPPDGGDGMDGGDGLGDGAGDAASAVADDAFSVEGRHDATFLRGDSNMSGSIEMADAIVTLRILFQGAAAPYCQDAADSNDDGTIDLSDAVMVLGSLYLGTGPLPEPGGDGAAGFDPTADQLFCVEPGA